MPYKLSFEQQQLSDYIINSQADIYVNAVCGAGKTEIVFAAIEQALSEGKRVGFFIPRKEVVREIAARLRSAYKSIVINEVYGGQTAILDGEIIVLTTHQAYRYKHAFGLIIVDEYDAFPFKGNDLLHDFVMRSCYGKKVFLSATFTKNNLLNKNIIELNKRYHNHPLVIPKFYQVSNLLMLVNVMHFITKLLKNNSIVFVYLPTIELVKRYYYLLKKMYPKVGCFHSKIDNKKVVFMSIKKRLYQIVVTTTILERGITIKDLDVIVAYASDQVFDRATLIQIAGRVGRIATRSYGEVILLGAQVTSAIKECIKTLNETNEKVSFV